MSDATMYRRACRAPRWGVAALVGLVWAWGGQAVASSAPALLRLQNPYVLVTVNAGEDGAGRFSVSTTGGNPERGDDDNKPLIYGGDEPWTSFTTVQVDGSNFVFGGRTLRPAGQGGPFGQLLTAPRLVDEGKRIEAAWRYGPGIEVSQHITLTRGPSTGLLDTVRIEYIITNRDSRAHEVGLRVVVDAMAGSNDGAPFRVGAQAVETDTSLTRGELPEFWQAFDSLERPAVVAQGTLRGGEVTPPDRVYFTNWGVLREALWDFDFSPGREFWRKGEYERDSAVALFFEPRSVGSGESRSVVVYYGLGGISIAPGVLAVGLSGPEMAVIGRTEPFTVVAYVQNTGRGAARETNVTLELPEGLALASGHSARRELGTVAPGATAQAAWEVQLTASRPAELTYRVRAEAANAEPNVASRRLRVVQPARLTVRLRGPAALSVAQGRWEPVPFRVEAEVTNEGGVEATAVWAQLFTPYGLKVAPRDAERKYIGTLGPQQSVRQGWQVVPAGVSGNVPYSVRVMYPNAPEGPVPTNTVAIPPLPEGLALEPLASCGLRESAGGAVAGTLGVGSGCNVAVHLQNMKGARRVQLELAFATDSLRVAGGVLGVDRGTWLQAATPARGSGTTPDDGGFDVKVDNQSGKVIVTARRSQASPEHYRESVAVLRLVGIAPGEGWVRVERAEVFGEGDHRLLELNPATSPRVEVRVPVKAAPQASGTATSQPAPGK